MVTKMMFFVLLLFCLSGCSAGRQSQVQSEKYSHSAMASNDSVRLLWLSKQFEHKKTALQHIEWMPPDTNHRQFVKSVTILTTENQTEKEQSASLESETNLRNTFDSSEQSVQVKEVFVKKKTPYLFWGIGIVVFIGILTYIRKYG